MKVGIMGTHGTGKTTMAYQCAEVMQKTGIRAIVLTGVARSCPWPINQGASEEAQRWIYHTHMVKELEYSAGYEAVYCDRTVLDSIIYSWVLGFRDMVKAYMPAALAWLSTYDHLYWMRPREGWLVDDGVRDVDVAFQRRVDDEFSYWIDLHEIPVTEIRENLSNQEN